jgi:hypothetical protein
MGCARQLRLTCLLLGPCAFRTVLRLGARYVACEHLPSTPSARLGRQRTVVGGWSVNYRIQQVRRILSTSTYLRALDRSQPSDSLPRQNDDSLLSRRSSGIPTPTAKCGARGRAWGAVSLCTSVYRAGSKALRGEVRTRQAKKNGPAGHCVCPCQSDDLAGMSDSIAAARTAAAPEVRRGCRQARRRFAVAKCVVLYSFRVAVAAEWRQVSSTPPDTAAVITPPTDKCTSRG